MAKEGFNILIVDDSEMNRDTFLGGLNMKVLKPQ